MRLSFPDAPSALALSASPYRTGPLPDPRTAAPEVIRGQAAGPSAEVWALGLFAFRLRTGHAYFAQAEAVPFSYADLVVEVLAGPRLSASARAEQLGLPPGTLPRGFDGWFARCVAEDPAERFATALLALRHFEEHIDVPAPPSRSRARPASALPPTHGSALARPVPESPYSTAGSFVLGVLLSWCVAALFFGALLVAASVAQRLVSEREGPPPVLAGPPQSAPVPTVEADWVGPPAP